MTFTELIEEVKDRGLEDIPEARIKKWINEAYREITDMYAWPFLEETKEGTAPVTISDLGHVLSVTDKTHGGQLLPNDRRKLVTLDPKLSETGTATYWYTEGETSLKVWPADTVSTFVVRYVKHPAELSTGSTEPLVPTPYQGLLIDGAEIRGMKKRDNPEAIVMLRAEWTRGVQQMVKGLLRKNYDRPITIQRSGFPGDYL